MPPRRPPQSSFASNTEAVLGSPVRNLVSILVFVSVVVVGATIADMRVGWPFADAIYMVLLTVYTVGYGEVRPINTSISMPSRSARWCSAAPA